MAGWIKMFRELEYHWIIQNEKFFKWWFLILVNVNYQEGVLTLNYETYPIKIGECAYSLRKWAKILDCSPKQVSKFFKLLEKEGMISKKIIGKGKQSTTLINITNYSKYQGDEETQTTTQKKRKRPHEVHSKVHTIEEGKERKNKSINKNINTIPHLDEFLIYAQAKIKEFNLNIERSAILLKYEAWIENDWQTGGAKPRKIKNWKSTLLNTLKHLEKQKEKTSGKKEKGISLTQKMRNDHGINKT